ncbi:hypothetical protein P4O66_020171, partial [Electrophorus voltai]
MKDIKTMVRTWDVLVMLGYLWLNSCLCQTSAPQDDQLKFRLSGYPRKHNEGRVEVFYRGEWGTICDDDFTLSNAHVLCHHLGFVEAISWSHSAKYGAGTGKIWLDNVVCTGTENSIDKCVSRGWGNSDCTHEEDAGVVCKDERLPGFLDSNVIEMQVDENRMEEIRLRPLSTDAGARLPITEGVLEVKYKEGWAHICSFGWTTENSRVVCGMMGFPSEKTMGKKRHSHPSLYRIHSVACTGNEAHLSACTMEFNKNISAPCPGGGPVAVRCMAGPQFIQGLKHKRKPPMSKVRLKGGARAGEGRVEVLKDSEWGTVCDDHWNLQSASVVCRQLGFGTAKEAQTGARMGQGIGPIHMNEVRCHGDEKSLWKCPHKNITAEDCKHMEDASVKCNIPYMGFDKTIQLTGGRTLLEGRVELLAHNTSGLRQWGLICGDGWTSREAMVACRQLGLGHASSALRIRMVGGRTDHEGRVEVQVGSRWGFMCSDGWSTREAMVSCRQLGLSYALHAITETWYWDSTNVTEMVMSGVKCHGDEMTLTDCQHHHVVSCKRTEAQFAAGVICSDSASDLVLNAPLVEQSVYIEDRLLHLLYCAAEENCLAKSAAHANWPYGQRRLLRFSSEIHNIGRADFRPRLGRHSWVWHECHRHYHSMDVFTHYDLLALNGTKVADGHKASFCLEDTDCHEGSSEGVSKRYECANFGEQGITVGCWDTYRHDIDCQWIDISDVKPGNYILQVVLNPNFEVPESDFTNNAMRCNCKYDGNQ